MGHTRISQPSKAASTSVMSQKSLYCKPRNKVQCLAVSLRKQYYSKKLNTLKRFPFLLEKDETVSTAKTNGYF